MEGTARDDSKLIIALQSAMMKKEALHTALEYLIQLITGQKI